MLGFFKFINGKYNEALNIFLQVKKLSPDIAILENQNTPNTLYRLRAACAQKKMIFNSEERKKFKGKNFLRLALAEMEFGTEQFTNAKEQFEKIYSDSKSSKFEQAAALIGLGYCYDLLEKAKSSSARNNIAKQTWVKAMELSRETSLERHAMWMNANYLAASTESMSSALEIYKKFLKKYPNDENTNAAIFSIGMCYFQQKKIAKMLECYHKLKAKDPSMIQVREFERLFKFFKINPISGRIRK